MRAFTAIDCADPRAAGYVKVRNRFGGIEYIPLAEWERLALATADTTDADFAYRYCERGAVVGVEADDAPALWAEVAALSVAEADAAYAALRDHRAALYDIANRRPTRGLGTRDSTVRDEVEALRAASEEHAATELRAHMLSRRAVGLHPTGCSLCAQVTGPTGRAVSTTPTVATIRAQGEDYVSATDDTAEVAAAHGLRGLAARLRACAWVPLGADETRELVNEVTERVTEGDAAEFIITLLGCILVRRTEATIDAAGVWRRGGRTTCTEALSRLRSTVEREQEAEGRDLGMLADPV